jgi:hypothetical protein
LLIDFKGNRERPSRLICFRHDGIFYHRVHFFDACPPTPQNASPISRVDTNKTQTINHLVRNTQKHYDSSGFVIMSGINEENDNQSCTNFDLVKKSLATTSNELVTAVQSKDERGTFVEATQSITLQAGSQNIMTCQPAAFALDSAFRQTHCGFCAASTKDMHTCSSCQMVSACSSCLPLLTTTGHHTNKECSVLKKFKATFGPNTIDSTHFLTIRLLCCQEGEWWKLFLCLYANVAATSPMEQDIAMICSHLPAPANDTHLYTQTLARVLGCSHNITDVSRPLGNQSLGRAMFLEQSFYNHSCVPNAFLSCNFLLPTTDDHTSATTPRKNALQLTANVHLLRPV